MFNVYKILTVVVFLGSFLPSAYSSSQKCEILFSKENIKETEVLKSDYTYKLKSKFAIDKQRLQENGFKLMDNGNLYDISEGLGSKKIVGHIDMYEPSFVFEWAGKESSKTWIERGGILAWEMKEIIWNSSGPAVNGKGYYVSMDLLDSQSYGDAVTAFKIKRPLVTLRSVPRELRNDPKYVERLKRAGLDGFSNAGTWLAIFNSEILKDPTSINNQVLNKIGIGDTDIEALVNIQSSLGGGSSSKYRYFIRDLEDNHLLKKISRKNALQELSEEEKESIFNYFRKSKHKYNGNWESLNLYRLAQQITAQKALSYIESKYVKDVEAGLKIILDFNLFKNKKFVTKILSLLKQGQSSDIYGDLLELFDLRAVSLASQNKSLNEEIPSLDKMKEAAASWRLTKERIDRISNVSLSQLIAIARPEKDFDNSYRDGPVYMGSDTKSNSRFFEAGETLVKNLEYNRFLSTEVRKINAKPDMVNLYVEYPSVKNFRNYQNLLSDDLVSRLRKIEDIKKPDFDSSKIQKLNQEIIEELMRFVLDIRYRSKLADYLGKRVDEITALDIYTLFMSIHPFEDGNGRLGRMLYYSYNKVNELTTYETLVLPVFDLDLFSKPSDRLKYLFLGNFFKNWVQKAQSDSEFIKRTREALHMFKNTNKEVNDILPDLEKAGG